MDYLTNNISIALKKSIYFWNKQHAQSHLFTISSRQSVSSLVIVPVFRETRLSSRLHDDRMHIEMQETIRALGPSPNAFTSDDWRHES